MFYSEVDSRRQPNLLNRWGAGENLGKHKRGYAFNLVSWFCVAARKSIAACVIRMSYIKGRTEKQALAQFCSCFNCDAATAPPVALSLYSVLLIVLCKHLVRVVPVVCCDVSLSTKMSGPPSGAVSTRGLSVFVPGLLELCTYGRNPSFPGYR